MFADNCVCDVLPELAGLVWKLLFKRRDVLGNREKRVEVDEEDFLLRATLAVQSFIGNDPDITYGSLSEGGVSKCVVYLVLPIAIYPCQKIEWFNAH